jgi:hypothetical protein
MVTISIFWLVVGGLSLLAVVVAVHNMARSDWSDVS